MPLSPPANPSSRGYAMDIPVVPMNAQSVESTLNNDPRLEKRYGITPTAPPAAAPSSPTVPPQQGGGLGSLLQQYDSPLGQNYLSDINKTIHKPREHMASGGLPPMSDMAPWYTRREATGADEVHSGGLFPGNTGGRTDVLNRNVPAGAYVIPADVVSGLGEGNTGAGANILDHMMHSMPHGIQGGGGRHGSMGAPRSPAPFRQPSENLGNLVSRGGTPKGDEGHVPIVAASGEYLIHPDQVKNLGGGDIKHGHRILDAFVVHVRKKTAKTMQKLPGPKGAKK